MEISEEEVKELKKTWKGKLKLYRLGVKKFKQDPPIYRVHMMQGLAVKLTIYMIIFACIYAVSIGLWVFSLIILPVGTIGNYYAMKSHFMKYKDALRSYEWGGMISPIEEDISPTRKRWRIIEKQIGFFGLDIVFALFTAALTYSFFSGFDLWGKIWIVFGSIPVLGIVYFVLIYKICKVYYEKGKN